MELRTFGEISWGESAYEALGKASTSLLAGATCCFLGLPCGITLLAESIGIGAVRLALNSTRTYANNLSSTREVLRARVWELVKFCPNLRVITFVFAVALAWVSLAASMVLGFVLGAGNALIVDYEQCTARQKSGTIFQF